MKKRVTVYAWLLAFVLIAIWVCGVVTGYSVGNARADSCSGWNGRFFQTSQCDNGYSCQGVSFGPFWTQSCNNPNTYAPSQP